MSNKGIGSENKAIVCAIMSLQITNFVLSISSINSQLLWNLIMTVSNCEPWDDKTLLTLSQSLLMDWRLAGFVFLYFDGGDLVPVVCLVWCKLKLNDNHADFWMVSNGILSYAIYVIQVNLSLGVCSLVVPLAPIWIPLRCGSVYVQTSGPAYIKVDMQLE